MKKMMCCWNIRRSRTGALSLLLCLMLLAAGCGSNGKETMASGGPQQEVESSSLSSLFPEKPEESEAPEETPVVGNDTQVPSAILSRKEPVGDGGNLWYIPLTEIEAGLQQVPCLYQGKLLLAGSAGDFDSNGVGTMSTSLKLISLESGEVLKQEVFAGIELPELQVCGEQIVLADWSDGEVLLLDSELKVTRECQVQAEYGGVYVSPDASTVYSLEMDEGIRATDVATGKSRMQLEGMTHVYSAARCGDAVTFSYTDKKTQLSSYGVLDLVTGEIQTIPFVGSLYGVEYVDGVWLAGVSGEDDVYYLGATEQPQVFSPGWGASMLSILTEPARLMANVLDENGDSELTLYDMEGNYLSGCKVTIPGFFMIYDPIWSEADQGYFLLGTNDEGKDMLLFWDLSKPGSGQNLVFRQDYWGETPEGTVVAQELYQRAEALTEKYGVEILIAERTGKDFGDYAVEQEFYEVNIQEALALVDRVLGAYPEGFFQQLLYGDLREIELHLVGQLTKLDLPEGELNGFTTFEGFAQERAGKAVFAVDITQYTVLEQTLHHEIFHLIDNKLSFDAGLRENSRYSEEAWMKLNPEGFEYAWDTSIIPESFYSDGYDLWFTKVYSRTYPREDRATIMEYGMVGAEWMFVEAPKRQAKLEYLCKCIRDTFDTTGWPEVTVWEDTLARSR